jgi:hypothetical protein
LVKGMDKNTIQNKNIKLWIILSGVVGLLPFVIRLFALGSEKYRTILDCMDFIGDAIIFGYILNIVNIQNIDNIDIYEESNLKFFKGFSIILLVLLVTINGFYIFRTITEYSSLFLIVTTIILDILTVTNIIIHIRMGNYGDNAHV